MCLFCFVGYFFRQSISLNWYAGQVPVLARGGGRQNYDIGEADIRSAVELDFAIQRAFWSRKKIILQKNLRLVTQDNVYVLQYFYHEIVMRIHFLAA